MAWQAPASQSSSGTIVTLGTTDSVFVASNVVIGSSGSNVVRGTGSGHQGLIYGTVVGSSTGFFAVHLGDSANLDHNQSVHVRDGGHVQSLDFGVGVACYGYASEVVNDGIISSISGVGVVLRGSNAATKSVLINTGTIEGNAGITRFGVDAIGETIEIHNSGVISGELAAYTLFASEGGAAKDLITNTGTIVGKVNLFKGDDLYDGSKGFIDGDVNAGEGDDRLFGGKENNVLRGEAGADVLMGGLGADTLSGGTGADDFVFRSLSDSRLNAAGRDVITDFSQQDGDSVDLSAIDADRTSKGNQDFDFIGGKSFSGDAGELRYIKKAGDTFLLADGNGDGKADFAVKIEGIVDFERGDFVL